MSPDRARGFVSIEMLMVLIVIALAITRGTQLYMEHLDGLNQQVAAQQQAKVAEAGSRYIKDHFAAVLATAGPTAPAVITVPMLKSTRYLPQGFSEQNLYGQEFRLLARKAAANQLETLLVTHGGESVGELGIRRIAQLMGAQGGFISKTNPAIAQGSAWQISLSQFGIAPGAGHLATALFFENGALVNDYLYRNAVPGRPELNRMNTGLNMGGNSIDAAASVEAYGDVSAQNLNAGNEVRAQSVHARGEVHAQNVNASGYLNAQGNVNAQHGNFRGEVYAKGWLRTRGNGGWFSERWGGGWYMSDSAWVRSWADKNIYTGGKVLGGELQSTGRTYVGEYLQLNGIAVERTACPDRRLMAKDAAGQALSCQGGIWRTARVGEVVAHRNCFWAFNGNLWGPQMCPAPYVQVGLDYNGVGGGYAYHRPLCCQLVIR